MGWIVRMTVAADTSEAVTAGLWDLGSSGVAEVASTGPAAGPGPTAAGGPDSGSRSDPGSGPELVELLAGFETEAAARNAAGLVGTWPALAGRPAPAVEPVDDSAWVDAERRVELAVAGHRIELEIGAAFGDGGHASTGLALDLLAEVVSPGASVLDVGTGTGILALAARAQGAGPVTAVDNDPAALAVAARNLDRHPELAGGRVDLVPALPATGAFDVVVVNVVLGTQRLLAPAVAARLAAGGTLVLAGILVSQEPEVAALFPALSIRHRRHRDDWLGLVLGFP